MSDDGVPIVLLNNIDKLTKIDLKSTHVHTTAAAVPWTLMTWRQKYVNSSPNPEAVFFSALKVGIIRFELDELT